MEYPVRSIKIVGYSRSLTPLHLWEMEPRVLGLKDKQVQPAYIKEGKHPSKTKKRYYISGRKLPGYAQHNFKVRRTGAIDENGSGTKKPSFSLYIHQLAQDIIDKHHDLRVDAQLVPLTYQEAAALEEQDRVLAMVMKIELSLIPTITPPIAA